MTDVKKAKDTLAILRNMLDGCDQKLDSRDYVEQWTQLEKDRIKLQQEIRRHEKATKDN